MSGFLAPARREMKEFDRVLLLAHDQGVNPLVSTQVI